MSWRLGLGQLLLLVALAQLMRPIDGRKKLCGDALNEALDLICVNGFSRRILRDSDISEPLSASADEALRLKWHQLALRQQLESDEQLEPNHGAAAGAEQELRRPRRRITHQCCHQGCSYEDIVAYCA